MIFFSLLLAQYRPTQIPARAELLYPRTESGQIGHKVLPEGAQDPPKEKPKPKVLFAVPFAVVPGRSTKVAVRGLLLDQATEAMLGEAKVPIKSKAKSEPPKGQEADVVGNTQMELEIALPPDAAGKISLTVATTAGTAEPYEFLIVPAEKVTPEKEQNGGFATAQPIESGRIVQGSVSAAKDVDVFRIEGRAGERWTFEVTAHRHGSPLDATLTLYDKAGRQLSTQDHGPGTRDPTLRATLPADGVYFLSLVDAHDQGSPRHLYLLSVTRE